VILRLKDFDDYEDAALMKQKIAACLAVITSDVDGTSPALGSTSTEQPEVDSLEPGMILNVPPGRSVTTVQPPAISEHEAYSKTVLRAFAAGLGIGYEDVTGNYENLPFSAARMSRLRCWARVDDWRWRMLIPQFCDPVWRWAMQIAGIMGLEEQLLATWTPPPMPMIEPDKEGLAVARNVRAGITTMPEAIRERGYDPEELLQEYAEWNRKLDALGIILDSDPRRTTQQGGPREAQKATGPTPESAAADDDADRLIASSENGGRR
jgi:capsid protein